MSHQNTNIRHECLSSAESWVQPSGEEIREVLRLAGGLSGSEVAKKLGLGSKGSRTVRRWISEEAEIPYAAWAILCDLAGLGIIWKNS
jgi:transposase